MPLFELGLRKTEVAGGTIGNDLFFERQHHLGPNPNDFWKFFPGVVQICK